MDLRGWRWTILWFAWNFPWHSVAWPRRQTMLWFGGIFSGTLWLGRGPYHGLLGFFSGSRRGRALWTCHGATAARQALSLQLATNAFKRFCGQGAGQTPEGLYKVRAGGKRQTPESVWHASLFQEEKKSISENTFGYLALLWLFSATLWSTPQVEYHFLSLHYYLYYSTFNTTTTPPKKNQAEC